MSEYVPEGALLPSGINVDETAAYFGITDSSQILMELESLDRHASLAIVLNKISDLLLTDTFDLDSGSNRLQVESGEIYHILSGPLKLLELAENLQDFLGLNPEGNTDKPNITEEQFSSLESLLNPLTILKIYAIGDVTGGNSELAKYTNAFDKMIKMPAENLENLIMIQNELTSILLETKNMQMPRSISILKSATPVTAPTIAAPQKQIVQEIKPPEVTQPADEGPPLELQQPTALKPPATYQTGIVEATPLTKPEPLEKPKISPIPPVIQKESTTMEDIEKNSTNTDSWVDVENKKEETTYSPPEQINIPKPIIPKNSPVTPKSKPVQPKILPTSQIQSNTEIKKQEWEIKTATKSSEASALPKPKQKFSPMPKSNTNGIIRTFPKGNICRGCGVSMSNSWRYCALCGSNF